MSVDQVLFGYYIIPRHPGSPLEVVVNPEGNEARSLKRYTALLSLLHCNMISEFYAIQRSLVWLDTVL